MRAAETNNRDVLSSLLRKWPGGLASPLMILPALVLLGIPGTGNESSYSPTACPSARLSGCPPVRLSAVPPHRSAADLLFQSHDVLHLTLEADLNAVRRDVTADREEHDATLSYSNENGELVKLQVTVETRGRFRRDTRNCNFPPLKVDFKKDRFPEGQLNGTLFEDQNELKLVCHCQDNDQEYEQFVLKEYLAYRVYRLFSEVSFSVRLAQITYVDAAGRREPFTRYAFFIEDEEKMAERNGAVVLDSLGVRQVDIDDEQATLFSFFQYFIGNTDWKVSVLHNVKLLDRQQGFPIAVPYDFDWAGAVDPPYAAPHPDLGTSDVRERVFISPCRTDYDIGRVINMFNEHKDAIYELYANFDALDERSRQRSREYMDEFYEILSDPDAVRREFVRSCPGD